MGRRRLGSAVLVLPTLVLAACGGGPTAPTSPGTTLTLPAQVTGTVVTCATCTPAIWAFAETAVIITNQGDQDRRVATLEARVLNRSRSSVIATNTRPNQDAPLGDRHLPRNGSLALEAGVVYMPLPPPRDEVWFVVVVMFEDGGTVEGHSRLFTPTS